MTQQYKDDGARLTVFRDGPPWDGVPTATVGRFHCDTALQGAALLTRACTDLSEHGAARVIGPMDGNTWNSYRLVTESDGSAPFLMEPQSGPEDLAAFEVAGFAPIGRFFSARVGLDGMPNPAPAASDLRVEAWDGTDPEGSFAEVHALSCEAFSDNAFYTPLSRQAFLDMYMPFVPMLRPEFVLFARDGAGACVGFLFGLPNYAEGTAPTSVILKTYASLRPGAGHALAHAFHAAAQAGGYETAIHALIHETNLSAQRSAQLGATTFRRYALMGRRLDVDAA